MKRKSVFFIPHIFEASKMRLKQTRAQRSRNLKRIHFFIPVGKRLTMVDAAALPARVLSELRDFYAAHPEIKESHGLVHVTAVHSHAKRAIAVADPPLAGVVAMEIEVAAYLHDVDDRKYFSGEEHSVGKRNAKEICGRAGVPEASVARILAMIGWVGCSENGNTVPEEVESAGAYHWLIPRWADRLEAVGAIGVVRCYQYNQESGKPLSSGSSPRATTPEEVFRLATPDRFEAYMTSGGQSDDMISHYYDKLLHVARPPPEIVRNSYLEEEAESSSRELVEVCVRFGRSGKVDEAYIHELTSQVEASSK
jgi:uncharacterized protein